MHGVLKDDLAGGRLPSGLFGANAAWWAIAVLSFNPVSEYGAGSELRHEAAGVGRTVGEQATESSPVHPDRPSGPGDASRQEVDHPSCPWPSLIRIAAQGAAEAIGAGCRAVSSIGVLHGVSVCRRLSRVARLGHAFFGLRTAIIGGRALSISSNTSPETPSTARSDHR